MSDRNDESKTVPEARTAAPRTDDEQALLAEAERLAADPGDDAEARSVLADMKALRVW